MLTEPFIINYIVKDGETATREANSPLPKWLILIGEFDARSDIRLSWDTDFGRTVTSSGLYYVKDLNSAFVGSRLIVNAPVDNAQGSDTEDFIQGNENANTILGDASHDGVGGSDVLWGAAGNDTIFGGAGDDEVSGDDGDDILFGDAGEDVITGNGGIDTVFGGAGRDMLYGGGDAGDTISYFNSPEGVIVDITFGSATIGKNGDAAGDTIEGFRNATGTDHDDILTDTVRGTIAFGYNDNTFLGLDGDDVLTLGGGNDRGAGGAGDDDIFGGKGNDDLLGGAGDDYLVGGGGRDKINGGTGVDVLLGGGGADAMSGGSGDDRLLGNGGSDQLTGNGGDDLLRGEGGNDDLSAGGGDDRLIGGAGRDLLTGGAGADVFVFNGRGDTGPTTQTRDTITDFSRREGDIIDLAGLDANPATPRDDVFVFLGQNAFDGTIGALRSQGVNNGTILEMDLDGDTKADMSIFLQDIELIRSTDFLL